MATLTRQHFKSAAEIVKCSEPAYQVAIANAFEELFEQYNPNFDSAKFWKACGLEE